MCDGLPRLSLNDGRKASCGGLAGPSGGMDQLQGRAPSLLSLPPGERHRSAVAQPRAQLVERLTRRLGRDL